MALNFPLLTSEFMDLLKVQQMRMDAPEQVEFNQTGGGEILRANLAPMLWQGDVRLGSMTRKEASDPDVLLDVLRQPGASFYAYDTRRPYPLLDPTGVLLGAAAPTIQAAAGTQMRLQNMPAGYVLSRGDYIAFDYGTAPVRRALHRVVTLSMNAVGSGNSAVTGNFDIFPPLRAGVVVGTPVTLRKPSCKAVLIPASVDKGASFRVINRDMTFRFQQTLR